MPFSSVLGASSVIKPGVCTSTTRPSVPYEGQLIYETDTDMVAAYNGSAWVYTNSSGLVLVKSQTIGSAVSSVSVTNAFSATYDNYRILVSGGTSSTANWLGLQIGNATSGYYWGRSGSVYGSQSSANDGGSNTASFGFMNYTGGSNGLVFNCDVYGPFTATNTGCGWWNVMYATGQAGGAGSGFLNNVISYTDFTITVSTGTISNGLIRVYGYAMS